LFGHKVTEHRKLAGEIVIDTDDLFLQIGGSVASALEGGTRSRFRENAGVDQSLRIGVQQRSRNFITGKRLQYCRMSALVVASSRSRVRSAQSQPCGGICGYDPWVASYLIRARRVQSGRG